MKSNNFAFPLNNEEYIGNESCIDLQTDIEVVNNNNCSSETSNNNNNNNVVKSGNKKKEEKREFPPTIPLLAGGTHSNNMPWILKRYYTSDGRLVLKEEKVENHHECFQAHRANGRLTLKLASSIPLE
ncbi:hypothetical protein RIF29_11840 [Crotalaria pallida]|uniref:FAF domain-containing protein n=1 Tax=Crotalaria pallida TaxID=3830 RepID=A0AAN9P0J6_CROPI